MPMTLRLELTEEIRCSRGSLIAVLQDPEEERGVAYRLDYDDYRLLERFHRLGPDERLVLFRGVPPTPLASVFGDRKCYRWDTAKHLLRGCEIDGRY